MLHVWWECEGCGVRVRWRGAARDVCSAAGGRRQARGAACAAPSPIRKGQNFRRTGCELCTARNRRAERYDSGRAYELQAAGGKLARARA
eukprot:5107577-Prymnesium_polylepis.1